MTISLSALHTRALLLDIEGTTTPVDFVYQVLFPYARTHAAAYLQRSGESAACRAAVAQLEEERGDEEFPGRVEKDAPYMGAPADQLLAFVYSLMDRDKKSPGLKALQGLIWEDGYKSGELRGQVFPDVAPAFERWRSRGLDIYIYSSGSVLAQRLLFGSTAAGDLTTFLKGYFDTGVGPKTAPGSYSVIADRMHTPSQEILFVSDVVQELDAARAPGMQTALCIRGAGAAGGSGSHPVIRSFEEIVDR